MDFVATLPCFESHLNSLQLNDALGKLLNSLVPQFS